MDLVCIFMGVFFSNFFDLKFPLGNAPQTEAA